MLIRVHLWLHFCSIRQSVVTFNHDGFAALETFDDLNLVGCADADCYFCFVGHVLIVDDHHRSFVCVTCFECDGRSGTTTASFFEFAATVTCAAPFARNFPSSFPSVTQTSTVRFVGSLERLKQRDLAVHFLG